MKLQLRKVLEHGHAKERVIEVLEDANLNKYILFGATYTSEHKISNKLRYPFWFPSKN